jgi:hypothetical protein
MNEEKIEIRGFSQAAFFLIPVLLGFAALLWLSFGVGCHDFKQQIGLENRRAEAVGASPNPTEPLKIVINNKKGECRVIDKADLDGSELTVYWHRDCIDHVGVPSSTIRWMLLSPDGTIVQSNFNFTHIEPAVGQKAEFRMGIETDSRASVLEVKARWNDHE